jgi:hypothetical protein
MSLTLLELVIEFCDERGLDRPSAVMSTTDGTIRQIRALLNKVVSDIVSRPGTWARLQRQGSFTSVAAEDQGLISAAAPYGFKYIIPETIYDRTNRRQLFGPRAAPQWQMNEAMVFTGPYYAWRLWQDHIQTQPAMPAELDIYFEYASNFAILATDGTTYKKLYSDDADTFTLEDDLLLRGLEWRWRREQGLSFSTEFDEFEQRLHNEIGRQSTAGTLDMAGTGMGDIKPAVLVPLGNWSV